MRSLETQPEAQIRPVQAETVHTIPIGQPGEGPGHLDLQQLFEQGGDQAFHHPHDVLFGDEGHLHIDLGELRLPVGPEVLIPEAAAELIIAIQAGHHQELLEELGRLRQGEELSRLHPAGHQVVPGPLRRALGEDGRLDLDKALAVQELPGHLGGPVPEEDILHDAGASQVQVAVLQPQGLGDVHLVVFELEGRGLGAVQQAQFRHHDLDLAGGQVRVDHLRRPGIHHPPDGQDEFIPQHPGLDVGIGVDLGVKDHLGEAVPVPEVHEDEAAVVPAALHPTHEHHFPAGVRQTQLPAGVAPFQAFQTIKH